MKVVNLGSTLRIFSDELTVEDRIPAGTYDVNFDPMGGYSLSMRPDFKTTEKFTETICKWLIACWTGTTKSTETSEPS